MTTLDEIAARRALRPNTDQVENVVPMSGRPDPVVAVANRVALTHCIGVVASRICLAGSDAERTAELAEHVGWIATAVRDGAADEDLTDNLVALAGHTLAWLEAITPHRGAAA